MKIETLTPADFDNSPKALTNNYKYDTLSESASSAANIFRITDIRQAVRNPNRANIFINGKYSFSLDISQLSDHPLKINQTLTPSELEEYHHLSTLGKLYTRTLEWVLTRPRSIQETRNYLRHKIYKIEHPSEQNLEPVGFSGLSKRGMHTPTSSRRAAPAPCKDRRARVPAAETRRLEVLRSAPDDIIERLVSKGYLDDAKFAKYLIENYHAKKGASRRRLELELQKKGISRATISEVLSSTPRDETTEIQKLLTKKAKIYKSDPQKLLTYLLRQGFPYETAQTAVREMDSQSSSAQTPSSSP